MFSRPRAVGHRGYGVLLVLLIGVLASVIHAAELQPTDPEAIHMFPLGGQPGTGLEIEILGRNLEGAHGVWMDTSAIQCQVIRVEPSTAKMKEGRKIKDIAGQKVVVGVQIDPGAGIGPHALRLVSGRGVSNSLIFWVVPMPTLNETTDDHGTAEQAQAVTAPVAISGRIAEDGEADYYKFKAHPDQELAFEVVEGVQRMLGDLRRAPGFALELYGQGASWFDVKRRVKLGATNTAVLHKHISAFKPRLVRRFEKSGWYTLQVKGEVGAPYQLQMASPGDFPPLVREHGLDKLARDRWRERDFSRQLEPDRMFNLRARSVGSSRQASLALMEQQLRGLMGLSGEGGESNPLSDRQAAVVQEREPNDVSEQVLSISIPSIIEGAIERPADVDLFWFRIGRRTGSGFRDRDA